ncbi:cache domain-containing sensor histidine kinase [Bacillus glycinifermentans]|uniref:cache domain-containing sensor histidine kinase n=1 Tax=Bacillus glycinifermentans TaxID=1664069 RepID=UPI002DBCF83F|nr:sensor histidine kinase [Bacillus glycinifermentans]MEC3606747.1 sensor histidine kinase [Bacillus glycinifermentans]
MNRFQHLKIKDQLFILISFIMAISLILMLSGVQYAFHMYDQQIYRKSSQVLMMSSKSIEDELKKIEDVSYQIATDQNIQTNLLKAGHDQNKYGRYRIKREIWDQLAEYTGSKRYIKSIHLVDAFGTEYSAGANSSEALKRQISGLTKQAARRKGGNVWVTKPGANGELLSAREIRSYKQLNFNHLGIVLIVADLKGIVADLPKDWGEGAGKVAMSEGRHTFFSDSPLQKIDPPRLTSRDQNGYTIVKNNGRRFFMSYVTSPYENWTYWSLIPFDAMFSKISAMKAILISLFILSFLTAVLFGRKIARGLTSPIEKLVTAMKHVQNGDFKTQPLLKPPPERHDEVSVLNRTFITMVERINELIAENYEKQLMIKETEFKALQAQINPHFLYNTLESINWLAKTNGQPKISKMTESLGFLLRNAVNMKTDVLTIEEEADIVLHYFTIQQFRFEERLVFEVAVDPLVKSCLVPKLILQPLAENAITYCLEPVIEPCRIAIKAFAKDGFVYLTVKDNGPGMDENFLEQANDGLVQTRGKGIGLQNIDERIKLMFGEDYGLNISSEKSKGTKITIKIPFRSGV